jgi:glycosyltransferase involved in cell wall biosynthesis
MRVLFFSNVYPNPLYPTKGTFNHSLIRALAAEHTVRVVSPISWTDAVRAGVRRDKRTMLPIAHAADAIPTEYPRFYYPPKLLRHQYGRFLWWSVGRGLLRTIEQFQPDVVVSYWAHPDGEVAVRAAHQCGVRAVTMVGGSDVLLLGRHGLRREAIHNVLSRSDAVIAVSRDIAEHLCADGIPQDKVHVVYRGVDRSLFYPRDRGESRSLLGIADKEKVLLAVGRLVPVKGYPVLFDACRQLMERDQKFACYVLGDGPLEAELKHRIDQAGLRGIVRLCGSRRQHELADWYSAADLVVLPSLSEGVPNVLLEAMSCGRSFVASNVGGIPEIADPKFDRLVPPGNPRKLADAITEQLAKRNESGGRRFEPLSWKDAVDRFVKVLDPKPQPVSSQSERRQCIFVDS